MSVVGGTREDLRESITGLCCPVSFGLMEKAVVLPCGHSLDEESVKKMNESGNTECPECRASFDKFVPNYALRTSIESLNGMLEQKDVRIEELEAMVARLQAAEGARVQQQTTMEALRAQASQTAVPMPIYDPVKGIWT